MKAPALDGPFRGRYRKTDLVLEAVIVLLIALLSLADSSSRTLRADVALTVQRSVPGRPVPAGFLGLSMEYTSLERYAGTDPSALNPILVQLIRNLSSGQAPVLRIGGDSTDRTWWPEPGVGAPPGIRFTLDQRWLAVARALTRAVNARLILGINLEANSPTLAQTEANALVSGLGSASIRALEPGNEPELYGSFGYYRAPDGTRVTGRPAGYDYPAFAADYRNVAAVLPHVPLAGPAFGNLVWTPNLNAFLSAQPGLGLATLHRYPLQRCFIHPDSPRYATVSNLLAAGASSGLAHRFAGFAAIAHAHHLPLRIDEFNTVSCGAVKAVSHTFASALWAADVLFELVHAGVDGVNVHTFPGAGYDLFTFRDVGGHWHAMVWPEYYGLLLFARAAPAGSHLVPVAGPRPATLKAWATASADGSVRVVLINKDPAKSHVVAVRVPGSLGSATVTRLEAPTVRTRSGVTLGGQGFGTDTDSGTLKEGGEKVGAAGGRYTISVPAASAALLTISGVR